MSKMDRKIGVGLVGCRRQRQRWRQIRIGVGIGVGVGVSKALTKVKIDSWFRFAGKGERRVPNLAPYRSWPEKGCAISRTLLHLLHQRCRHRCRKHLPVEAYPLCFTWKNRNFVGLERLKQFRLLRPYLNQSNFLVLVCLYAMM